MTLSTRGLRGFSLWDTYPSSRTRDTSFSLVVTKTWEVLSVPHNPDLNSGNVRGFGTGPQTLEAESDMRWDAARAYYFPVEHGSNLKRFKGTVERIIWAPGKRNKPSVTAKSHPTGTASMMAQDLRRG
jgi:hypothetical protein